METWICTLQMTSTTLRSAPVIFVCSFDFSSSGAPQDTMKAGQRFAQRTKQLLAKRQRLQEEMLDAWFEGPAAWGWPPSWCILLNFQPR